MKLIRNMEKVLWAGAVLCIAAWSLTQLQAVRAQTAAVTKLEAEWRLAASAPTDQSLWSKDRARHREEAIAEVQSLSPLGLLTIAAVDIRVAVFNDTNERVLNVGAGRVVGTAQVGEGGNLAIAAHRDGYFRGLKDIKAGDEVSLQHSGGVDTYTVSETLIVQPDDVSVLAATATPMLTLITCYPFYYVGSAPERFIVKAELKMHPQ